ncbi:MAG: glutamine-hydrolyzing GMP synthase [Candidatus Electryonea clarkiae]|nr:glutamine-hydrolyzing GMP synthase [Candidatus Electryonea clarkiae]MDP8288849.1 glutamine-hydrolyzing GMP synthase [Candidatus Electryonea clarkiae]
MSSRYDKIAVVDFGSQYTQLIARRIREEGVYAEIITCTAGVEPVKQLKPAGIILSGGPSSVFDPDSPDMDTEILNLGIPVLGICYGMHLLAKHLGGKVTPSDSSEYGRKEIEVIDADGTPLAGSGRITETWMSHGDQIERLPDGFKVVAESDTCPVAAMANREKKIFALQFHPEVRHTVYGKEIIRNFLFEICQAKTGWSMATFQQLVIEEVREKVGDSYIIGAVSGGVDSSVMAALLSKAVGDKFIGVFVDNGLLRKGERENVRNAIQEKLGIHLEVIEAAQDFLDALKGIEDPEEKRRTIGRVFIEIFEKTAKRFENIKYLAQGTLYPDVIESISFKGPSATIKTHHNVGGLPDHMNLDLIEPLRELFKDEVRQLGRELGIAESLVSRHPFPGPGLGVRILGEVTEERLEILREADYIFINKLRENGWYDKVSQALVVLLPVKSVGVMGDARTYENVVALRSVDTWDFMTADFSRIPLELLGEIATQIINEVKGVNRVVYDVSSKPPATVEWE